MASAHIKQSKTLANLSHSRQLYTPQHTRDEAIGDVDRNKHFNDVESYIFIKQKWPGIVIWQRPQIMRTFSAVITDVET